jgi:hypothetical protein
MKRTMLLLPFLLLVLGLALPAQQLVGYYPFNGNAKDMSGNGNDGQVFNATLVADRNGKPNSAYSFDGSKSYILVKHSKSLTFPGSITVECWAKINDSFGGVVTQHVGGANGNWLLGVNQGRMKFALSQNGLNAKFDSVVVNDNKWHHMIGIYDAAKKVTKHYLDGKLVLTQAETNKPNTRVLDIKIGDEGSGGWKLRAIIDDVKIYQGVLLLPGYDPFGSGCQGTRGVPALSSVEMPKIGNPFSVLLTNLPLNQPGFIFPVSGSKTTWGAVSLPLDLGPMGLTGCKLLVSGDVPAMPLMPTPIGVAVWGLPIPNSPALVGAKFYNQAFFVDPKANPAGVTASNAAEGVIGS